MSKNRSLSKVAKKIIGDKRFKKLLANWIVEALLVLDDHDVKTMLMSGQRGHLAMTEIELCKIFDKTVVRVEAAYESDVQIHAKMWGTERMTNTSYGELMESSGEIVDAIFEKILL